VRGDPLAKRATHWTRWQRGRAARAVRHRAHLDVLGNDARSAWLCSWQRSGSTWLAEVLASAPGSRLIYEPANLPGRLFTGEAAALEDLPTGPGEELDAVERALVGRVHGPWVDRLGSGGALVARRVVKDVRAMGLLGTVAARHPATPVVVLVRHPLAVARSAVALGWSREPEASVESRLLAEVRRWCRTHADALAVPAASRSLVVSYEHTVSDPGATLERIKQHLVRHHATWRELSVADARLSSPSATDFRGTAGRSASEWIGSFDDLGDEVVADAAALLNDAGLGGLYGTSPLPLVGPDEILAALVR
jgi:Sulfotransferase family